jgi:starch synthase
MPDTDALIAERYSQRSPDVPGSKLKCKQDLQKTVKLPLQPSIPVMGMVCRLDPQKGFTMVLELIPKLLNQKKEMQWIILGTGNQEIQDCLTQLQKQFPQNVVVDFSFNDPLAHKIYAGGDFFFMPSEFEPCGLGQMIAMRYGTIPVATPTGGLLDTIIPFSENQPLGTGFIAPEISVPALEQTLVSALKIYENKMQWQSLVRNAMSQSFSWKKSAMEYLRLYDKAVGSLG